MASFGDLNRVGTNVQSIDAQLSLNRINRDLANSRERLTTGSNINRAEDDAAGYSIATKLKSRVAGLEQSLQNVGDAKSVLDIAESSFDIVMDSLIEMKALATQAANDTLGTTERSYIGDQLQAIGADINEIANQTIYQDQNLLNGVNNSGSIQLTFQTGERAADTIVATINAVNIGELFAPSGDTNLGATATAGGG
ncbi:MAG: flagellin, partial [Balneolaceae bacterium]